MIDFLYIFKRKQKQLNTMEYFKKHNFIMINRTKMILQIKKKKSVKLLKNKYGCT